ncbi:hypothetical protein SBBP2_2330009 [Burkholderiales bacterium]|nr:hypothetical protein SBBP2_2330009 [Burkholderiales bacterium]
MWLTDLRHYFGSQLAETGTSGPVIRDLMGHSTIAVTSRYLQSAPAGAAEAVAKIMVGAKRVSAKSPKKRPTT